MKSLLKKFVSRRRLIAARSIYNDVKMSVFKVVLPSKFMVLILYLFRSRYYGEQSAVLRGNVKYFRDRFLPRNSYPGLRRNIHRLEKGLLMKPRRSVFGEGFIIETVDILNRAVKQSSLDSMELHWAISVLDEYFSVVRETEITIFAQRKFAKTKLILEGLADYTSSSNPNEAFIPYSYNELQESVVSEDDLRAIFIKRRSVRWFKNRKIDKNTISKVVELASLAPSACNRQPFRFIYVSCSELASKVAECAGGTAGFSGNIPAIFVVVGDQSAFSHEGDRHVIYIDSSLAAMQLMLAAVTVDLGTCPINWPDNDEAEKRIRTLVDIKSHERIVMLIAVGYPDPSGYIAYSQKKNANVLLTEVDNAD